jgi:hypothetical protein
MNDDDADRARVLGAFLDELQRERAFSTGLAVDLEAVQALLSEALTVIARHTIRLKAQTQQLREVMGYPKTPWHAPIRFVDGTDVEIPPDMVRTVQIRWTPFDGR